MSHYYCLFLVINISVVTCQYKYIELLQLNIAYQNSVFDKLILSSVSEELRRYFMYPASIYD